VDVGDTLQAFANGRKDDWDVWLPYAVFAINSAASLVVGDLIPALHQAGPSPPVPFRLAHSWWAAGSL
jgi:hypothetical protein